MAREKKVETIFKEPLEIIDQKNQDFSVSLAIPESESDPYWIQVLRAINNLVALLKGFERFYTPISRVLYIQQNKQKFIDNFNKLNPETWVPRINGSTTHAIAEAYLKALKIILDLYKRKECSLPEGGPVVLEKMISELELALAESCYKSSDDAVSSPRVASNQFCASKLADEMEYKQKLSVQDKQQKEKSLKFLKIEEGKVTSELSKCNQNLKEIKVQLKNNEQFALLDNKITAVNLEIEKLLELNKAILDKEKQKIIMEMIEKNFGFFTLIDRLGLKTDAMTKLLNGKKEEKLKKKILEKLLSKKSVSKRDIRPHWIFFCEKITDKIENLREAKNTLEKSKSVRAELVKQKTNINSDIARLQEEANAIAKKIQKLNENEIEGAHLHGAANDGQKMEAEISKIEKFINKTNVYLEAGNIDLSVVAQMITKLNTFQASFKQFSNNPFEEKRKKTIEAIARLDQKLKLAQKEIIQENDQAEKTNKNYESINKKLREAGVEFQFDERWRQQFKIYWEEKLNTYKEFRSNNYRYKDLLACCFFDDKGKREKFIMKLIGLIYTYNGKPERLSKIKELTQKGIDKFKVGWFSNKKDKFLNLNGLLQNLQACVNVMEEEFPNSAPTF